MYLLAAFEDIAEEAQKEEEGAFAGSGGGCLFSFC
jgi:hypothetical protein